MQAVQLKQIDMDYRNHLQAFLNFAVKAQKGSGKHSKPAYKKFKQFFDYEAALDKVKKKDDEKSKFTGIGKLLNREE